MTTFHIILCVKLVAGAAARLEGVAVLLHERLRQCEFGLPCRLLLVPYDLELQCEAGGGCGIENFEAINGQHWIYYQVCLVAPCARIRS